MKKLLYVLIVVLTVLIGLTFTYMNNQTVQINYLSFDIEVHLSVLLVVTFAIGAIAGYFASFLSSLRTRRDLSKAKKEIRNLSSIHS